MLPVQSLLQKIFRFRDSPKSQAFFAHPVPQEGRFAIVTDVGCGMRWTLWRADERREADGEVVWS